MEYLVFIHWELKNYMALYKEKEQILILKHKKKKKTEKDSNESLSL